MASPLIRRLLFGSLAIALGGSCIVASPNDNAGPCSQAEDCPSGYQCVAGPRFTGKSCQAVYDEFKPDLSGVTAFYCTEVKAILDTYCIACHTSPPAGGADASFRLDQYTATPAGAKEKADRIAVRVKAKTMPPGGNGPDANQTSQLEAWAANGAPECATPP